MLLLSSTSNCCHGLGMPEPLTALRNTMKLAVPLNWRRASFGGPARLNMNGHPAGQHISYAPVMQQGTVPADSGHISREGCCHAGPQLHASRRIACFRSDLLHLACWTVLRACKERGIPSSPGWRHSDSIDAFWPCSPHGLACPSRAAPFPHCQVQKDLPPALAGQLCNRRELQAEFCKFRVRDSLAAAAAPSLGHCKLAL